jgi:DNA-binding NarL/FixJ family response regulator
VAFALRETESEVISWAQAGIHGYIPRDTSLTTLVEMLNNIVRGEQACPSRIASGMLRWIARHAGDFRNSEPTDSRTVLTTREEEVADLMSASLSNKEIARRLGITVATTKSHVHSILSKLGVHKRGLTADRIRSRA